MPRVKLVTLATLYEAAGGFEHWVEIPGEATVLDAIRALAARSERLRSELLDSDGRLLPEITVLVDGRPVEAVGGLGARLRGGETIYLIPPAGGGAPKVLY